MRGRRHFLRGVGGSMLAIPFLPSLLPRTARAQTAARPRFFVNMSTPNGGGWAENMFPGDTMLTESTSYAGRMIQRGDLTPVVSGGTAALSPILTASSSTLTPSILSRMNVIAGFDMPRSIGHHTGGYLGNYARNDNATYGKDKPIPTLDQVMAYSPSFYPDLGTILLRSIHLGTDDAQRAVSWYWANPVTKTGDIVGIAGTSDSIGLFNKIFVTPPPPSNRTPVIDSVFANYQRLRQSNRRLSNGDKDRLDQHLTRIAEIQRRSKIVVSCTVNKPMTSAQPLWVYPGPQGITNSTTGFQLLNDIIVAAFSCGTSRIATFDADLSQGPFTDYVGGYKGTTDFHSLIHLTSQTNDATSAQYSQTQVWQAWQRYFELAFLDLVKKLEVVDDGMGGSLLDSALIVWEQECCAITHSQFSMPIVTVGGAGGALRTGSYIDYRNRALSRPINSAAGQVLNPGLVWNQWMGVKLQAMGVERSEYENDTFMKYRPAGASTGGYGWFDDVPPGGDAMPGDYNNAFAVLGDIPPYLKP
jgi:hypothetical protein